MRTPQEKVDGLEEAIHIVRGVWSEPSFTFCGRLYHTHGVQVEPKPEHPIPIWLGTYGRRALDLTGRLADGWIPSLGYASPEQVMGMRERILAGARQAGRSPEEITCVYNLQVRVDQGADPRPSVVSGSPEAVAKQLVGFTELGFGAFNFVTVGPDREAQAERLAHQVIPAVRGAFL